MNREDLHEYQNYSVDFIKKNPIVALLLSCGLGKTVTTLTAINDLMFDDFEISKVLVVCPLRVGSVWKNEVEGWEHLNGLRISVAIGTKEERLKALNADADIYVINRENLQWLIDKSGIPFSYDMVVLDELSSFKNWQSKRFKAFMKVRPMVKRVVGLTGTPTSNGLMDLFAEFKCLDMGKRLGRLIGQYRDTFFTPGKRNGNIVYTYNLKPGAKDEIYRRIGDITISMEAKDHLKMPSLVNSYYQVKMDHKEYKHYARLANEMTVELPKGEVTAANAAVLCGKLTQMANGAIYVSDGVEEVIHDRKLDALEDIIESANGQPVLVAYWFKHDLERIKKRLDELGYHYGRINSDENIQKWNNREFEVGLIHPASAGHGLNLQKGGNIMVWFGMTWSLELYQQTIARLWRQGQASGTVSNIHIVTEHTIDARITNALKCKDMTQKSLIEAVKAEVSKYGK